MARPLVHLESLRQGRVVKEEERKAAIEKTRALFHHLWTKNVGTPGYDKKAWMDLQWVMTDLGVPL